MTGIPLHQTDVITINKREGDWPARLALMAAGLFCLLLLGLAWAVLAGKVGGVGDLRHSVDGLNAGFADMGVKQDTMGRDVTDLTKRVDSMASNVDRLKTDMASVKERTEGVARVEDKLNSMEKQLSAVTDALNKIAADRQQWQSANETMATHIAATREAANAAAEQSKATAARVDSIDREVKDMQRVVAEMQSGRSVAAAPVVVAAAPTVAVAALPAASPAMSAPAMVDAQAGQPSNPSIANSLPAQSNGGNMIVVMEQPMAPAPAPAPAPAAEPATVVVFSEPGRFPIPTPNRMTRDSEPHGDNTPTEYTPYDYRYTGVGPVRMSPDSDPHDSTDTPPVYTQMTEPYYKDGHGLWGAVAHREAHYAKDAELRPNHGEPLRGSVESDSPDRLNRRVKVSSVGRNYAQSQLGIIGVPFDAVGNGFVWVGEHVDSALTGTRFVKPEGK